MLYFTNLILLLKVDGRPFCTAIKRNYLLYEQNKSNVSVMTNIHETKDYSSYVLSKDEKMQLPYGLENHIPTKFCRIAINTEFEQFYQRLLHDISHIPEEDLAHIKTKLRNTCQKYSKIKVL